MGSRFLTSFLVSFLMTVAVLAAGGLAITKATVRKPRDPFRTAAFEFDLATGWSCELDGTEYVCMPPGQEPRSAIAIIAMKERNKADNLQAYEEHLTKPQVNVVGGTSTPSQVKYVKRRTLGAREWVEALHLGSEIATFETYYLGTVTSNLGVLVTMSVREDHAAEYIQQLNGMMETLNVYQR